MTVQQPDRSHPRSRRSVVAGAAAGLTGTTSANTADSPDEVTTTVTSSTVAVSAFTHAFRAHSVTLLEIDPR